MQRVSTRYQYDSYMTGISAAYTRMSDIQRMVATGKKQDLFVHDPGGAGIVVRSTVLMNATKQYDDNLRSANDYLKTSEASASDVLDMLKQAYTTALQGANSSTDQSSRATMANTIASLQKRLVEMGNARGASGQYVFAGGKGDAPAFQVSGTTLQFNGDSRDVLVETSPGVAQPVNLVITGAFVSAYNALENLRNNLTGGNLAAITTTDVQNLQNSMDAFKLSVGDIGSRLQLVQEQTNQNKRRIDEFTQRISDVEDVDMAQAITDYQLAQNAYQAALQSSAMNQKLSLMDFIG